MSTQSEAKTRAIELAGEVLRGERQLDSGLEAAQGDRVLSTFVNCLNSFAEQEIIDVSDAEQRVRTGKSREAVEGKTDPLAIPDEILRQAREAAESSPPLDLLVDFLTETQAQLGGLREDLQSDFSRLELLRASNRTGQAAPKPWLTASILFAFTLVACLIIVAVKGPLLAVAGVLVLGLTISGAVLMKEMNSYKAYLVKKNREDAQRDSRVGDLEERIEATKAEIDNLQRVAAKKLDSAEYITEDDRNRILVNFQTVFPAGSSAAPRKTALAT